MQINKITTTSFQGGVGYKTKQFSGALKDGSNAMIKFSHDGLDEIKSFDYCLTKGEGEKKRFLGGFKEKSSYNIEYSHIDKLLAKLQIQAKEGINFFQEFTRALLSSK